MPRFAVPLTVAALLMTLGTGLVACGGDDTGSNAPTTEDPATGEETADEAGLEAAVRATAAAFAEVDAEALLERMSQECRATIDESAFEAELGMVASMSESFGMDLSKMEVTRVAVRDVADSKGEAQLFVEVDGQPSDDEPEWDRWVHEDGLWRAADCDMFATPGDMADAGDVTGTTIGGDLVPADEASEAQARAASTDGSLGEPVQLDDLTVTVSVIERAPVEVDEADDVAIAVTLRVENRSGDDSQTPIVTVTCIAGEPDLPSMYLDDLDDYEALEDLPSGSFTEGTSVVGVPLGCEEPLVRVEEFGSFDDEAVADWAVPPAVFG